MTIETVTEENIDPLIFRKKDTFRYCKIVATIGPSSCEEKVLRKLIESGLNVARLNFSHGDHAFHKENIQKIRKIANELSTNVTILQDLQGPKIRCGQLIGGEITLQNKEKYTLTFGTEQTDPKVIPIDYKGLVNDVKIGDQVMMDDGLLILKVIAINNSDVEVEVIEGGLLKPRKGVNFPDSVLSLPALTEKDRQDLLFGVSEGVDVIALSFVQNPEDVLECKRMIHALGADIPVIAKIEKLSAIEYINAIAETSDGLMVARGDLGVEGKIEKVPLFQKTIIAAATKYARPVIIATQMLESMITNPKASLAEMADVANGVLDGADCLMLSGEVASGKFPVKCVKTMDAIIREVEKWTNRKAIRYTNQIQDDENSHWEDHKAIARSAGEAADQLNAKAIVCLTLTGSIAKSISKWRPHTPIIAISPRQDVIQRLSLVWGVYGLKNPLFYNADTLLQNLPEYLKRVGIVHSGETIVITAGIPLSATTPTNMIKIDRIP